MTLENSGLWNKNTEGMCQIDNNKIPKSNKFEDKQQVRLSCLIYIKHKQKFMCKDLQPNSIGKEENHTGTLRHFQTQGAQYAI